MSTSEGADGSTNPKRTKRFVAFLLILLALMEVDARHYMWGNEYRGRCRWLSRIVAALWLIVAWYLWMSNRANHSHLDLRPDGQLQPRWQGSEDSRFCNWFEMGSWKPVLRYNRI